MFNTEIFFSTFIYIIIFLILISIVSVQLIFVWKKRDRNYYLKFFGILCSGLIYNVVEGLLPDKNININIISQNIFAWIVGIAVAYNYFIYIKHEYNLIFLKKVTSSTIGMITLLALIVLFILPYTITGSLVSSRILFLTFLLVLLLIAATIVITQQFKKFKNSKSLLFKIHDINGALACLALISLPITILIFGDNQFIEQTFFSLGFFIISIDYFLYNFRKKEIKKLIPFEKLSSREAEVLTLLLKNPNLKYSEISEQLNISEKTLSSHLSNIYKKIEIKSKKDIKAISKAYWNSLIE